MQVDFLDRYSRGSSLVHRVTPRLKLVLVFVFVLLVLATPELVSLVFDGPWASWLLFGAEAWLVMLVYSLARLPWGYLALRLGAVLPFLLMVALAVPLNHRFERGWHEAAQMLARSLIVLSSVITLVATTPFRELLVGLEQLGMPRILISILAFMYRYMFVLVDELTKMRRAKLARTFYPSLWGEARLMGNFIGILLVRAFERAERVYAAMCARGWQSGVPRKDRER
jgi:cobalt/nickel transport system permease protein